MFDIAGWPGQWRVAREKLHGLTLWGSSCSLIDYVTKIIGLTEGQTFSCPDQFAIKLGCGEEPHKVRPLSLSRATRH